MIYTKYSIKQREFQPSLLQEPSSALDCLLGKAHSAGIAKVCAQNEAWSVGCDILSKFNLSEPQVPHL